jgi:hypothetical protein
MKLRLIVGDNLLRSIITNIRSKVPNLFWLWSMMYIVVLYLYLPSKSLEVTVTFVTFALWTHMNNLLQGPDGEPIASNIKQVWGFWMRRHRSFTWS